MRAVKSPKKKVKKTSAGVTVVAGWMILATLVAIYAKLTLGMDVLVVNRSVLEWSFYGAMLACGMGLLIFERWAWKGALLLFVIYELLNCYMVYFHVVPDFAKMVEINSGIYAISPGLIRVVLFTLIIVSMLWPIIVILFLMHPSTKSKFIIYDLAKLKETLGEIKPG